MTIVWGIEKTVLVTHNGITPTALATVTTNTEKLCLGGESGRGRKHQITKRVLVVISTWRLLVIIEGVTRNQWCLILVSFKTTHHTHTHTHTTHTHTTPHTHHTHTTLHYTYVILHIHIYYTCTCTQIFAFCLLFSIFLLFLFLYYLLFYNLFYIIFYYILCTLFYHILILYFIPFYFFI
jgi:hypothetical protein